VVGRFAAVLGLAAGLGAYYALHERLWSASDWWDVAFLSFVLIPACFALVWFALPLRTWRWLLPAGLMLGGVAWAFNAVGWHTFENFAKLLGVTLLGFWFLSYFETVAWVVLVAAIIPIVDAYSVARGPTKVVLQHHEQVFTNLSFAFPIPGENTAANLGLPDLLFFALFLAAAARFGLRPGWTWVAMVASFGATIALAVSELFERVFNLGGLPALPLLSIAFLLVNADLLWRQLRHPTDAGATPTGPDELDSESAHTGAPDVDTLDSEGGG
jgi:uncharacterized membrane protein YjjB (DUF3815 family)